MGWLMAKHIKDDKAQLNFSEFGSYSEQRQQSKLKSRASQVSDGDMPLSICTWMHKKARLTKEEKELIINWAQQSKDSLVVKR